MWPTFIRRTALSLLGALLAAPLFAQTINPQNQINWAFLSGAGAPTLTCSSTYYNMPYTDTAANVHYFCTVAGWVADASANGTGTTGYYTLWTGSDTVGNGHLDDGVTTAGVITSTEPVTAPSASFGPAQATYNLFVGGGGNTAMVGNQNVGFGSGIMTGIAAGSSNDGFGVQALQSLTSGVSNDAYGGAALQALQGGSMNTAIGDTVLASVVSGSGNVGVGYFAGRYETGSNHLYVNNVDEGSAANDTAYSLLYGTFSGVAGSLTGQQLTVNGALNVNGAMAGNSYAIGANIVVPSGATGYTGTAASNVVLSDSPTFTGTPTAPTPASVISTTQIPTTAYVGTWYAPLASPTFTGTATAPTFNATTGVDCGGTLCLPATATGYTGAGNVVLSASPTLSGTTTIPTLKLTGTNTMTHVPRAYPAWHQTSGTSITTGAPFGPIFWSGEGQTIERLTANFTGTTTCSTAPVIAVFTCTTVACSSPTNIASLTTGTTAGGYDSGALSVSIPSGVFFTAEFTAGACSSKPAIDFAATVRVN